MLSRGPSLRIAGNDVALFFTVGGKLVLTPALAHALLDAWHQAGQRGRDRANLIIYAAELERAG
ncbi:MAG TPA: hypothetical protein VGQ29_15625 [Gemmatimonadales bacterium]|nr:hypothetical protein [Gemmatimonadales bacterium]